ncbi:MAG: hypothetical protein ACXIUM_02625 [Wenzhouxiangella sp.]
MTVDHPYSAQALLDFLKQAGMEGRINPAAARARRSAVEQLSSELSEQEKADVRCIDVDRLASRFHKLEGSSIRSEALALYVQRFRAGLSEFLAWREDPSSFQSTATERARALPRGTIGEAQRVAERIALAATENSSHIVPIPLRESCTVYVANLPSDLTRDEAERIARIIQAFAADRMNADQEEQA